MQTIIGVSYGGEFGGHEKAAVDLLVEMRRHTKLKCFVTGPIIG